MYVHTIYIYIYRKFGFSKFEIFVRSSLALSLRPREQKPIANKEDNPYQAKSKASLTMIKLHGVDPLGQNLVCSCRNPKCQKTLRQIFAQRIAAKGLQASILRCFNVQKKGNLK